MGRSLVGSRSLLLDPLRSPLRAGAIRRQRKAAVRTDIAGILRGAPNLAKISAAGNASARPHFFWRALPVLFLALSMLALSPTLLKYGCGGWRRARAKARLACVRAELMRPV